MRSRQDSFRPGRVFHPAAIRQEVPGTLGIAGIRSLRFCARYIFPHSPHDKANSEVQCRIGFRKPGSHVFSRGHIYFAPAFSTFRTEGRTIPAAFRPQLHAAHRFSHALSASSQNSASSACLNRQYRGTRHRQRGEGRSLTGTVPASPHGRQNPSGPGSAPGAVARPRCGR
jgi:hypothetical protein